jgi:hypothetical protein
LKLDDEIKSAYQIAVEKLAAIEEPTVEEKRTWKYVPEGEKLAAHYLKEDADLKTELAAYDDTARPYVARGIAGILLPGIRLPHTEADAAAVNRAVEAVRLIVTDTATAEELLGRLQQVFDHFTSTGAAQIQQAREQLKQQMTARVQQAMAQQMGGNANLNIDIEAQPEFQAEWRKVQTQFEGQYNQMIEEIRAQIKELI